MVPMILAVPILAGGGGTVQEILLAAGTALAILAGVLIAARYLVPRLLAFVARTRAAGYLYFSRYFLVCFGIAWALSLAGISLALGAFLAGLVVAGSEFRHQAMSDLIPAREVFASLFFVSVGMLLDVSAVLEHLVSTVGLLGIILVGKFTIILGAALILRLPLRVGILSAATLCQIGEFSFVLLNTASDVELLDATLSHNPAAGDHSFHAAYACSHCVRSQVGSRRGPRPMAESGAGCGASRRRRSRTAQRSRNHCRIWLDGPGSLPGCPGTQGSLPLSSDVKRR